MGFGWNTILLAAMAAFTLSVPGVCPAHAAAPKARVAVMLSFENIQSEQMVQGLRDYLDKHGAETAFELFQPEQIKDTEAMGQIIKTKNPDLIFALGTLAVTAASAEANDIPVVAGLFPTKEGLEQARNVTGVSLEFPVAVQFEWLLRLLPQAKTVGVLFDPSENGKIIESAQAIAEKMGLKLNAIKVSDPKELPTALEQLANNADVLWGLSDKTVLNGKTIKNILLFSFHYRIPFIGLSESWVKAGAFYALDRDYVDMGKQCGEMVLKILQGTPVKSVAPALPRTITYFLNLKTMEQMKVELPPALLQGAATKF